MSIQIDGLNKQQRAIADIIWGMDNKQDAINFIESLRGQARRDADTVLAMILCAVIDEHEDTNLAEQELKRFML